MKGASLDAAAPPARRHGTHRRIVAARTAMEWRKGFLSSEDEVTARRSTTQKKKVAEALPDEAFLPAETYDLGDDDEGDAADPRVAVLETSEEAHEYSIDHCRAHCSAYNKGLIKLDPEVTLNFCNDARAVMFNRKIFGHHEGEGKGGRQRAMLLPSGIVMQYLEWGGAALWKVPPWWCHSSLPWPPEELSRLLAARCARDEPLSRSGPNGRL